MLSCASNPLPTLDQVIGRRPYSGAVWTTDGMYLVARGPGALFIASAPVDLNDYRGVMLDSIHIEGKEGLRALRPAEEEWLRASLRRGLLRLFDQPDWSPQPDADVLSVRLAVTDVEFHRPHSNPSGTVIANRARDITMVLELRDSVSHNRVLVFGEKGELPFGSYSGSEQVEISRIKDAFRDFMEDARRHLVAAKRGYYPPPPQL